MNAVAFALPVVLFAVWSFIGYGVVNELDTAKNPTRIALLAPIAGLSIMALAGAFLSRLGLPVHVFGIPLAALLLCGACTYAIARRPRVPWRELAPFYGVIVVGLLVVGWPLARFGFDWISFGNDDMTTYLLSADHFFAHGYYQLPDRSFFNEHDPSWDYSFFYSIYEVRFASQILLAWLMSVTTLTAGAAYMPLIVGFHLVVIAAAGALVCDRPGRERVSVFACFIIAISSTLALGTYYQLLLQDFGIALVAAFASIVLRRPDEPVSDLLKRSVLAGMFAATLLIAYCEMFPFAVLPAVAYVAVAAIRRRLDWRPWLIFASGVTAATLLFANTNTPGALTFLSEQAHMAANSGSALVFPFYLTPLAFALLWGFTHLGSTGASVIEQINMVIGMVLYPVALVASVAYAMRGRAIAYVALVMLLFLIELFIARSGFGLFKLAMYMQPFALGTLALLAVDTLYPKYRLSA